MRILKAALVAAVLVVTGLPLATPASARSSYCESKELFVYSRKYVAEEASAPNTYDFYNRTCYDISEETEWPTGHADARIIPAHTDQIQIVFNKMTVAPTVTITVNGLGLSGNYTASPRPGFAGGPSNSYGTAYLNIAPGQIGVVRISTSNPAGNYSVCYHTIGASCV